MKLWVVGGVQRPISRARDWNGYQTAAVAEVSEAGVKRVLEYRSPPHHTPPMDGISHVFGAATIAGGTAYLCTATEVLFCTVPDLVVREVISHRCFNDLHHVSVAPDGSLYVVSTGLDAVAQLTPDGELIRVVDVLGGDVWSRFSPGVDYRTIASTKPHLAHPNYVFFRDGEPWVTCYEQRVARSLDRPATPPVELPGSGPHDGYAFDDRLYFTSVEGHLRIVSANDSVDIDLNPLAEDSSYPLGWCRGVLPMGRYIWVGFSRLRYTRQRQNISWLKHGFRPSFHHKHPTRLALYDLEKRALVREIDLEAAGLNAVFSIHEAPSAPKASSRAGR